MPFHALGPGPGPGLGPAQGPPPHPPELGQKVRPNTLEANQSLFFKNDSDCFLIYLEYLGVSKVENLCFWESWTRPPSPDSIKMMAY